MKRALGGLHHRAARRITGCRPRKGQDRGWVYPPLEDARVEARFHEVENFIFHCSNTVAQFIMTMNIMDLCLVVFVRLVRVKGSGGRPKALFLS